ncbi:MAG: LamG domain-containing protein, partial [Planctomycetota bacterium]
GGGPDQVIVSQAKGNFGRGKNWLLIDSMGNLKSEFIWLTIGAWDSGPDLFSSAPINDGQWHHVGFVWDSYKVSRILYVDGIEVAKDMMKEDSFVYVEDGGINIGFQASIMHRPGYFSGLIDDVRIYDRALTAEEIAAIIQ